MPQRTISSILFPSWFIECAEFRILWIVLINRTATWYQTRAEAGENAEFSFAATVWGYHVYWRVRLPHLGQRFNASSCRGFFRFGLPGRRFSTRDLFVGGEGQCTKREESAFTTKENVWFLHFSLYLHPNEPPAEFIIFLSNTKWPYLKAHLHRSCTIRTTWWSHSARPLQGVWNVNSSTQMFTVNSSTQMFTHVLLTIVFQ